MAEVIEILIRARNQTTAVVRGLQREFSRTREAAEAITNVRTDQLESELNQAAESAGELRRNLVGISTADINTGIRGIQSLGQAVQTAAGRARVLGQSMQTIGTDIREAGQSAVIFGAAIGAPIAFGVNTFSNFEDALARVRAVTANITNEEFAAFNEVAQQLGRTTEFSATQAAQGLIFLSQAGLQATESVTALPGVLQLATAGSLSLAQAADLSTNILSGYSLQVEEIGRVNDVLAFTSSNANTNISELGAGLLRVGSLATSSGESLEGVSAILGVLADNSVKGAEAGTAVRNMLLRLQNPPREARDALASLGVEVADSEGNFRGLVPILRELGEANLGVADAARIFGAFTANAAVTVANSTAQIDTLTQSLNRNAEGFAATIQATLLDTLSGDVTLFQSAVSGLGLTIGEELAPAIREFVRDITEVVGSISEWIQQNPELAASIVRVTVGIAALVLGLGTLAIAVGAATAGFGAILRLFGVFSTAVTVAAGAGRGLLIVLTLLRGGFLALTPVIAANPIGALVITITALTVGITRLVGAIGRWREAEAQINEIKEEQRAILQEQEALGTREQEIADAETIARLGREELQLLRDQLAEKIRLNAAELILAQAEEEGAARIGQLRTERQNIRDLVTATIDRENELTAAVQETADATEQQRVAIEEISVALQRTEQDARAFADSQETVANLNFDRNVAELDRVHEAQLAILNIRDDLPGLTEEYAQHFQDVANLASGRSDELIRIATEEAAELVRIQESSEGDDQRRQRSIVNIARQTSDRIVDIRREEIATVTSLRESALSRFQSLEQESARLAQRISEVDTTGDQRIAELQRRGLTEFEAFESRRREIRRATSDITRALATGDFQQAETLAQRQITLAGQLATEVRDGGEVQITEQEGIAIAVRETERAQERLTRALQAQKREVDTAKRAQEELLAGLDTTLTQLSTALEGVEAGSLELEATLKEPDAESTQAALAAIEALSPTVTIQADTTQVQEAVQLIAQDTFSTHTIFVQQVAGTAPSATNEPIPGFNTGGAVRGKRGIDKILAGLTHGEYVINKDRVSQFGREFFDYINFKGKIPGFQTGGFVSSAISAGASSSPRGGGPSGVPVNLFLDGKTFAMQATTDVATALRRNLQFEAAQRGSSR